MDEPSRVEPRVHLTLLSVQLLFAGFHVVAKLLFRDLHPLALAAVRVVAATPVLLLFAWRHDRVLPRLRDLPRLAVLGVLGVFFNQVLFVLGLDRTTATNAAILMPSIPVFAVALGALGRIERIGRRRISGIALAVAGALLVIGPWRFQLTQGQGLGNLLILTNCLSYAAFLVVQRPLLERLPWRTVIGWSFLFGSLGVVAVGGDEMMALAAGRPAPGVVAGLLYVVLGPTIFAYAANTWGIRRSSPTLVATYTTLQPLATALLARLVLAEPLGIRQLGGFLLIAGGLWRVSTALGREASSSRQPPGP